MAVGDLAIASYSPDASGGTDPDKTITPGDFTSKDGTNLTGSAVLLVRSFIHENDVIINRIGDPDTDGTFEINQRSDTRIGGGELTSESVILTNTAALEIVNTASSAQTITVIAQQVPASQVFVEQAAGVLDGGELARTSASRDSAEHIVEVVSTGSAIIRRRYDFNDDGVYEMDANIADVTVGTHGNKWLSSVDVSGRTNPAMQTALVNDSGNAQDFMLLGTIGGV